MVVPRAAVPATRRRTASEAPSVRERNTGTFAIGFMMAKRAANTFVTKGRSTDIASLGVESPAHSTARASAGLRRAGIDRS